MVTQAHEIENMTAIDIFSKLHHMPYSLLMDSADQGHRSSRYSYVAFMPVEMIEAKDGQITVTAGRQQKTIKNADPFSFVQKRVRAHRYSVFSEEGLPPFQGGAAGMFGYDMARYLEKITGTAQKNEIPDMVVGIYDQVFAYDHALGKGWYICHVTDNDMAALKTQHFMKLISLEVEPHDFKAPDIKWTSNFSDISYKKQVEKTIDYIKAGDIFQANISQRFEAEVSADFDTYSHYLHMREVNPAPYSSYFNLGNTVISSASPEQFISVQNGEVTTRPIKGTRPHVEDKVLDEIYKNSLQNSEKDQAENVMIVDLMRNDLSRVCTPVSIDVSGLCELETFSNVHHLVSTVKGKLKVGYDGLDLLRASFPGGSITGAPKIRAMDIIEEIEGIRRGPYCGSIGYIGFDGSMDSSILIRTLVYEGSQVSFNVGGGIVADSDPQEEYDETLAKAEGIFKSFGSGLSTHKKAERSPRKVA